MGMTLGLNAKLDCATFVAVGACCLRAYVIIASQNNDSANRAAIKPPTTTKDFRMSENAQTPLRVEPIVIRLREQRQHDMKAIRDAMVEDIENFDTYSKIADKEDEAILKGKQSMLTLFDVYQRWLEQL